MVEWSVATTDHSARLAGEQKSLPIILLKDVEMIIRFTACEKIKG